MLSVSRVAPRLKPGVRQTNEGDSIIDEEHETGSGLMLPNSPTLLALLILANALVGMAVGILAGRATACAATRQLRQLVQLHGLSRDAVIGSLAFVLTLVAISYVPWPRNTIRYKDGDFQVTSTMNAFQYPYRVAFALAIILPVAYELNQSRRFGQSAQEDAPKVSR